jgi:protein tyrosine kinase modulator
MPRKQSKESGPDALKAIAKRRHGLALVAFAVPAALATGLALFLPKLYETEALVLVDPPVVPDAAPHEIETRIEQLTHENLSRARLQKLVEEEGIATGSAAESAAEVLRRDATIETQKVTKPDGDSSSAIAVSFRGRDPERVAKIANALAAFYVEAERARVKEQNAELAEQLEALRTRLEEEEQRVVEFKAEHFKDMPLEEEVRLASVEGLYAELDRVRERQSALSRKRAASMPPPPAGSRPAQPAQASAAEPPAPAPDQTAAREELARLQAELRDLRGKYTDQHPDVQRAKRAVDAARAQIKPVAPPPRRTPPPATTANKPPPPRAHVEISKEVQGVESELGDLSREERSLERRLQYMEKGATTPVPRGEELTALLPRYDAVRSAYESLSRRYEELRVTYGEDGERGPFRVIEQAVVPDQPVVPNRPRMLAVGMVLSMLVAAAAVVLAEKLDGSFHTARELKGFTRLPVLATIPRIITVDDIKKSRTRDFAWGFATVLLAAAVLGATYFFAHGNETLVRMLVRKGG